MTERHIIDAVPLKNNGYILVKYGVFNRVVSSMSLADVPSINIDDIIPHAKWIAKSMTVYNIEELSDPDLGIDEDILKNILVYHCSNCGERGRITPYCPNCGAKMSLEDDEENDLTAI